MLPSEGAPVAAAADGSLDSELDALLDDALTGFTPQSTRATNEACLQPLPFDPLPLRHVTTQSPARGGEETLQATLAALTSIKPAAVDTPEPTEDNYEALLEQFERMGADPAMATVLDGMLSQLLSKDVLFEPLSMIAALFPGYLAKHASTLPPAETARLARQSALVRRLLSAFDTPGGEETVAELMTELQACGPPPEEIMQKVLESGEAGGAGPAAGCAQQ